jgi:hypothetical protein
MASESLKTSGKELKSILEKTGRSLKGALDKLEILNAIVDQIKDRVKSGGKMGLTWRQLSNFLQQEGLATCSDAKGAIQALIELRLSQLARLGSYVGPKASADGHDDKSCDDQTFLEALVLIPGETVKDIFCEDTQDIAAQSDSPCPAEVDDGHGSKINMDIAASQQEGPAESEVFHAPVTENESGSGPAPVVESSLVSSGADLMEMLRLTGGSLKGLEVGAEKLDILSAMIETIKKNVEVGRKMELSLLSICKLLEVEGFPKQEDAKAAIESLLELRARQISRLGKYVVPAESGQSMEQDDTRFKGELALLPISKVCDCFSGASITAENLDESVSQDMSCDVTPVRTLKRPYDSIADDSGSDVAERPTSVPRQSEKIDDGMESAKCSLEANLCPELRELLGNTDAPPMALDWSFVEAPEESEDDQSSPPKTRKEEAMKEVARILEQKNLAGVLGGGSAEDRRQEFRRIARLLHPDRGCVSHDDKRANMALRLALRASKTIV